MAQRPNQIDDRQLETDVYDKSKWHRVFLSGSLLVAGEAVAVATLKRQFGSSKPIEFRRLGTRSRGGRQ
jgi:hypothetical protein